MDSSLYCARLMAQLGQFDIVSLTTPPCTKSVRTPITASMQQIAALREAPGSSSRHVQPINRRTVMLGARDYATPATRLRTSRGLAPNQRWLARVKAEASA